MLADRLSAAPLKRVALGRTTLMMALLFSIIALIAALRPTAPAPWLSTAFLAMYVLFFAATGLNQLATATIHGKLIRVDRRGRLQALGGAVGSATAILAAWILLRRWLEWPDGSGFVPIFVFTAVGFAVAALLTPLLIEPADDAAPRHIVLPLTDFHSAWTIYRTDRTFRRVARVAMLMISVILLFPHFQWLASERHGSSHDQLVLWVIVQNVGVAVFSPVCGWLADRWGNRIVIRLQCFILVQAPMAAIALTHPAVDPAIGREWYWVVFLLLGICPVTMRTVSNYTLELATPEDQPRDLSTMRVCYLVPLLLGPLAGLLLDVLPASAYSKAALLFGIVSFGVGLGGVLTFWMSERYEVHKTFTPEAGGDGV